MRTLFLIVLIIQACCDGPSVYSEPFVSNSEGFNGVKIGALSCSVAELALTADVLIEFSTYSDTVAEIKGVSGLLTHYSASLHESEWVVILLFRTDG